MNVTERNLRDSAPSRAGLTCSEYCDSSHAAFGWALGAPGCAGRLFLFDESREKSRIVITCMILKAFFVTPPPNRSSEL